QIRIERINGSPNRQEQTLRDGRRPDNVVHRANSGSDILPRRRVKPACDGHRHIQLRYGNGFAERSGRRVSNDTHNGQPRVLRGFSRSRWWETPGYTAADGVLIRKDQVDEPLIDDSYRLNPVDIVAFNGSTAQQRNAHRLKISLCDGSEGSGSK